MKKSNGSGVRSSHPHQCAVLLGRRGAHSDGNDHPSLTMAGTIVAGCLILYMSTLMGKRLWNQATSQTHKQITNTVEHYISSALYASIIQNLILLVDRDTPSQVTNSSTVVMSSGVPSHQVRPDKNSRVPANRRISADVCSTSTQARQDSSGCVDDTCPFPTPQRSIQSFAEALTPTDGRSPVPACR